MISRAHFLAFLLAAVLSGCAANPSGSSSASAPSAPAPAAPAPIVVVVTATPAPTMVAVVVAPTPDPTPEPVTPTARPVVMDTRSPDQIQEAVINKLGTKILNATSQNEVQVVKAMVVMAQQNAQACKPDSVDPKVWSQIAHNVLFQNALRQLEQAADYKMGALNGEPYRDTLATTGVNTAAAMVATQGTANGPSAQSDFMAGVVDYTRRATGRDR